MHITQGQVSSKRPSPSPTSSFVPCVSISFPLIRPALNASGMRQWRLGWAVGIAARLLSLLQFTWIGAGPASKKPHWLYPWTPRSNSAVRWHPSVSQDCEFGMTQIHCFEKHIFTSKLSPTFQASHGQIAFSHFSISIGTSIMFAAFYSDDYSTEWTRFKVRVLFPSFKGGIRLYFHIS